MRSSSAPRLNGSHDSNNSASRCRSRQQQQQQQQQQQLQQRRQAHGEAAWGAVRAGAAYVRTGAG
jgi:ElaB/YqjD/DUF883 family membrane-anchored ribosome-binding protein